MDINLLRMHVVPAISSTIWLQEMFVHRASLPFRTVWTAVRAQPVRSALMGSQLPATVWAVLQATIYFPEYVFYVLWDYLTVILVIVMLLFVYLAWQDSPYLQVAAQIATQVFSITEEFVSSARTLCLTAYAAVMELHAQLVLLPLPEQLAQLAQLDILV